MNKKRIKTFRLLAVSMAAAMVLNNSGMTVLAAGSNDVLNDSEEIIVCTDIDGDSDEIAEEDGESEDVEGEANDEKENEEIINPLGTTTVWNEERSLTSHTTVNGDLIISGYVKLNGYTLTVNGNLITKGHGVIQMGDYGKLVVTGNFTQAAGYYDGAAISFNASGDSALVDVGGNFIICGLDNDGNEVLGGDLIELYSSPTSVFNIGGNLVFNTQGDVFTRGGIINLKGNLVDKVGKNIDDTTINLNGTSQQVIDISKNSELGQIGGSNNDILTKKYFNGELVRDMTIKADGDTIYINQIGEITGNEDRQGVRVNGHKLTFDANVINSSALILGDYGKVTVNGNYTQAGGYYNWGNYSLNVSGKSTLLDIAGDFNIYGLDVDENEALGGTYIYVFSSSESVINVGGNFTINTQNNDLFSGGGTINLKGNFVDKNGKDLDKTTINFNGTKEQIIDLTIHSNLGTIAGSNDEIKTKNYFNGSLGKDLTVKAEGNTIYINQDGYRYNHGVQLNGHKLTFKASVINTASLETGDYGKAIIEGDYTQALGFYSDGYHSLNVDGKSSSIDVTGNLNIYGLDNEGKEDVGDYYTNIQSSSTSVFNVGGNLIINTEGEVFKQGGTINLKGDFVDKNGKDMSSVTLNLNKDVNKDNKQKVTMAAGGKVGTIVLKSCGEFYEITEGCYNNLVKPEHHWDNGVVTKPTTPTEEGEKTFTCTVCGETRVEKIKRVEEVFDDINSSDWWVKAVQYVYENGIMAGTNGGASFDPNGKLTREQFTQVLYAYEEKPDVANMNGFTDVDANAWYAKSVYWAKEQGITGGKPDGTFGVGEKITRQDLAVMLYTYARVKGYDLTKNDNALDDFTDNGKISNYAKDAMKWAVTQGVISGKGNGKVDPIGNATRAECAQMIMKLIEKNK